MNQSRCKLFESRLQSMAVVDAEQSRIEWYKGRSLLRLWREAISNGLAKLVAKTVFWKGSINETAAFSYYLRLANTKHDRCFNRAQCVWRWDGDEDDH